jgi:hypothetical protein
MAAKRGHSFPPIWLKITLLNLPSAVRRAASDRTPVATLGVNFRCLTAGVAFFYAAARLFRALAFDVFFLLVFMAASLLGLGVLGVTSEGGQFRQGNQEKFIRVFGS